MKFCAIFAALFFLFSTVTVMMPDYADAARMGGGRSFGSKPFMNKSTAAPRQQTPGAAAPGTSASRPGGMFGGMGGLFGGLLAGTLLGSLLGGNGFSGGGFMDILLIGILAYLGYRLFMRFRAKNAPAPAGQVGYSAPKQGFDTNAMNREDINSGWNSLRGSSIPAASQTSIKVPAGFNVDEFLRGAKMVYNRLQKAWDNRDLGDISQFATPVVVDNLRQQLADDPNPGNTEIMLVNAQLEGFETNGTEERAEVYFDVLMRENPNQSQPEQVREIWHFVRNGENDNWKLDGIQQIDG